MWIFGLSTLKNNFWSKFALFKYSGISSSFHYSTEKSLINFIFISCCLKELAGKLSTCWNIYLYISTETPSLPILSHFLNSHSTSIFLCARTQLDKEIRNNNTKWRIIQMFLCVLLSLHPTNILWWNYSLMHIHNCLYFFVISMTFCNLQDTSHPCLVTSRKVQKGKDKKRKKISDK